MLKELRVQFSLFLIMVIVTGLIYPLAVFTIGQNLMPQQANGSLIENNGVITGSRLIGQNFAKDIYFHGRPSAAGDGYDAFNSSGSNFGPSSDTLAKAMKDRLADIRKLGGPMAIPVDLVTASGSGLDPDISPAAARYQMAHVAQTRGIDPVALGNLLESQIINPDLGFLGDHRINVLQLNMALDHNYPAATPP